MRKFILASTLVCSSVFLAQAGEWTGYISDSKCAGNVAKVSSEAHAGCAAGCLKKGDKAVLVTTDGKVVKIADSAQAKVVEHAGHKVTVNGTMDAASNTITDISDVKM
jgi:hypothetical protein